MKRTRQLTITIFVLVLALSGALFWSVTSHIRRARLNAGLIAAVARGDTAAVISLLNQGADPNTREEGVPPESWFKRIVAAFRHRRPRQTYLGRPLLTHAAGAGYPQIVQALLAKGATIDAKTDTPPGDYATRDTGGYTESLSPIRGTALIAATKNNRNAIVSALISAGANVNAKDANGDSALMDAAGDFNLRLVQVLVASGADVHVQDKQGFTPLLTATAFVNQQPDKLVCAVAQTLLAAGADANADPRQGFFTALMGTAIAGPPGKDYVQTAQLFLAHGAHVNAKNVFGETALTLAVEGKHGQIAALLRQAGAK